MLPHCNCSCWTCLFELVTPLQHLVCNDAMVSRLCTHSQHCVCVKQLVTNKRLQPCFVLAAKPVTAAVALVCKHWSPTITLTPTPTPKHGGRMVGAWRYNSRPLCYFPALQHDFQVLRVTACTQNRPLVKPGLGIRTAGAWGCPGTPL